MPKFLNNINLEQANDIQFKTTAGVNAGKIEQDGNDLVITNAVGDVLLGDGSSDVYIGDGVNNVDIIFEQSGAIKGDGSPVTLTIGGTNTSLILENPTLNNPVVNSKMTFGTANGYILFDYEPSGDTGEYTTEVPLLKVDFSGSERTILSRVSENGALMIGNDDTVAITAGDTRNIIKANWGFTTEEVILSAEQGFRAFGFPNNDTTWSNRNVFRFVAGNATASINGLYIGDSTSDGTQFIDLDRNLKNLGAIYDTNGSAGTAGQILSSTGSAIDWIDNVAGSADKALSLTLTVKNTEAVALSKGDVVCAAPSATPPSGNVIEIKRADNNGTNSMPAIGILNGALDAAGGANDEGEAIMFGRISGIDTSAFSVGDELFVSDSPGGLTATKPTGVKYIQKIGVVMRDDASNGTIEIFGAGRTNDVPTPLYVDHANQRLGIGTTSPKQLFHVHGGSTAGSVTKAVIGGTGGNGESYLYLAEHFSGDNVNYGFSFVADGNSSNNLLIKRHSNSTSGNTVITVNRDNDNVTFAGDVQIGSFGNNTAELAFGTTIANKVFAYGAEFQTQNSDIQVVLGRNNGTSVQGTGGIGASSTNAFHVYDTTSVTKLFEIAQTSGNATFAGDVTVTGDLIVSGSETILNTETVQVEDNIIQLNRTPGSPDTATAATSGITIYRGNGVTEASLIFDDADDTWDLTNNLAVGGNIIVKSNYIDFKTGGSSTNANFFGHRSGVDLDSRFTSSEGGWSYTTFEGSSSNNPGGSLHNGNGLLSFNTHSGNYGHQIAMTTNTAKLYFRTRNNSSWQSWQQVFTDAYHPNADKWTTARTITIGSTGKSVDGSADVSWTLAEIGAAASSHTHAASDITSGTFADARIALSNITQHTDPKYLRSNADDTATGAITFSGQVNLNSTVRLDPNGTNFEIDTDSTDRVIFAFNKNGTRNWSLRAEGDNLHFNRDSGSGYVEIDNSRILTTADEGPGNGLDADTLDGNHASAFALSSHTHAFNDLTSKTSGTGDYKTTGKFRSSNNIVSGEGSGGVALTINDGYGNANVTWNHENGVPEQTGNAARIEVNTDSTSSAAMHFELKSGATGGTATALNNAMSLGETYMEIPYRLRHTYDTDTYLQFDTNRIRLYAGGTTKFDSNNTYLTTADEGPGNGLDADTLDGQHASAFALSSHTHVASDITSGTLDSARIPSPTSGDWWNNGYVKVLTDGVMEGGKYFDMHATDTATSDYDVRLTASTGSLAISGDLVVSGGDITLSGTGRIQGVDTVSANTDAANKLYVDNAVSGLIDGSGATNKVAIFSNANTLTTGGLEFNTSNSVLSVTSIINSISDPDTNITFGGSNNIRFIAGGSERFSISSTQISAGVPSVFNSSIELNSTLIDINGSTGTSGQILSSTGSGVDWIDSPADNNYYVTGASFSTSTGVLTITGNNAAVGATVDLDGRYVEVAGDTMTGNLTLTGSHPKVILDSSGHVNLELDRGSSAYDANLLFKTAGAIKWRLWLNSNDNTLGIRDEANANEMVTFESGGNVGIGTTNPDYKLDVSGNVRLTGDLYVNGGQIYTSSVQARVKYSVWTDSTYGIGMQSSHNYGHLNNDYAVTFQMNNDADRGFWWGDNSHTNSQGAMSLTTQGKATIATSLSVGEGESITSPSDKTLHVDGETETTNLSYPYPTATDQFHGEIVTFGTFVTGINNGDIQQGDIIVYTAAGTNTGWFRAQGNTTYGKKMLGIAMGSSPSDGILIKGFARDTHFSTTGDGDVLYLSATSAGDAVDSPPGSTNNIVRIIGYMIDDSTDTIFFDPDKSWVQVS